MEHADVVVVGGRLGGCAVSVPLARAGRKVVVLDRMAFPSDQLSTHLLVPAGVSEIAKMGALRHVLEHAKPSIVRYLHLEAEGAVCRERMRPADDGIDFGFCVPRDLQDVCLVEAAREQGVDVRERCTFKALHWRGGRVRGVRYTDADGVERDVEATLVVGADGRRSPVAAAAGSFRPYRMSRNGRGLVFRYVDDPLAGTGAPETETYYQWREGESFALAFPSAPRGRMLLLFMGAREEASEARKDGEAYWARKLRQHPGMQERISGVDASTYTKIRSTGDCTAFFRASSGPGWALVGDAAHFKDPVTAQGMRDAMWMGRTLAEHVLPHLDDPLAVDRASRRWEAHRDEHCLPAYHFANLDTRVEVQSPALCELVRDAGRTTEPDLTDVFGRARSSAGDRTAPAAGEDGREGSGVRRAPAVGDDQPGDPRASHRAWRFAARGCAAGFAVRGSVQGSDHPDPQVPKAPKVTTVAAEPAAPAGAGAGTAERAPLALVAEVAA